MHDPRFEKEVQQKMEGLIFTPSEAVWANVEKAVNGDKRRRTPLFWLLFVPGMVAAAAIVYMVVGRTPPIALPKNSGIAKAARSAGTGSAATPGAGNEGGSGVGSADGSAATDRSANAAGSANAEGTASVDRSANSQANAGVSADKAAEGLANKPVDGLTNRPADGLANNSNKANGSYRTGTNNSAKTGTDKTGIDNIGSQAAVAQRSGHSASGYNSGNTWAAGHNAKAASAGGGTENTSSTAAAAGGNLVGSGTTNSRGANLRGEQKAVGLAPLSATGPWDIASAFRTINQGSVTNKSASKMAGADKNALAKRVQLKPKRSWEAGFAGGAGLSSVDQAFFRRSVVVASYSTANLGTSVTGATQNPTSSRIKPGLSGWVGILMQKAVSNRISVAAGMNLHYYSTRIQTGAKVTQDSNSYAAIPASYLAVTSAYAAPQPSSYPYYPTGTDHEYTNRYYFVELPVSVQWRINNSRTMPLFWEGGVSASYLMSSDGLYYDANTAVYYKDEGMTNRTQVGVSTALMAGLPFHGSRIQLGPQLQYSLARLLNSSASGDGHLFYGGIKLVVLPGKGVNKL